MTSYKWDGNTSLSKICYNLWVFELTQVQKWGVVH